MFLHAEEETLECSWNERLIVGANLTLGLKWSYKQNLFFCILQCILRLIKQNRARLRNCIISCNKLTKIKYHINSQYTAQYLSVYVQNGITETAGQLIILALHQFMPYFWYRLFPAAQLFQLRERISILENIRS
ncbi:Hypothetical_protein [Hexamita inflata]|uniref:Hypothetical_protein n=1 Tax=Hexamita inflata TaxID=28002 RepID=A0AA86NLY0_9EUKA|nr:Hypothetical protein HINF_LOCUS10014 [Hexamita inflata]CAI9922370.1 Hypothetical protein HINF_LOCUS10015 [Hexamita inflata]CAI9922371.1 Hypothetical protein HINF_LOCUS10016 [Hexamita inflata]